MKLSKKLLLLSSSLLLGATTAVGISNAPTKSVSAEEEVVLPSFVTSSIYRYAKAFGDTPADVDKALLEWLNDNTNLTSLSFFESDPASFDEVSLRKTKDSFYVLAFIQSYMCNGALQNTGSYPYDPIRLIFDHVASYKDDFKTFVSDITSANYEDAYFGCKNLYQIYLDLCDCVETDYYNVCSNTVETFIKSAKTYLNNCINKIKVLGFDESLNKYSYFKYMLDSFMSSSDVDSTIYDSYNTELLNYVLFDASSSIDTYYSKGFLDFTQDDFDTAYATASPADKAESEVFGAPYIYKMDRQMFEILLMHDFVLSYSDNEALMSSFTGYNVHSIYYKVLDFAESKRYNDPCNGVIMGFEIIEDFDNLLNNIKEDADNPFDLTANRLDLKYEKYLATMRLGSLVANTTSVSKFNKYLELCDEINAVSLEGQTYAQGVEEINALLENAYKELNTNISSTSEQAVLTGVEGLKDLSSRVQGYSFTLSKSSDEEMSKFTSKLQSDYGDDLEFADVLLLNMSLVNDVTKEELSAVDSTLAINFNVNYLKDSEGVKVYRYDEGESKVISLASEKGDLTKDYFDLDENTLSVHSKDFGKYAVVSVNKAVKAAVNELRESISSLTAEVNSLTSDVASKAATITELQGRVAELQAQVSELETKVGIVGSGPSALQAELAEVQRLLDEKENEETSKNPLNIIFIILTCVFAASTAGMTGMYFLNKKKHQDK